MENRIEKAIAKHCKGYNCSQAVLCAYHDLVGLSEEQAFKLAEGFGSGMGGLRDTCGAVTGMFMAASYLASDGDTKNNVSRKSCYEVIHKLGQEFKQKNGSLMCDELLTYSHHQRHEKLCTSYVEDAAMLLEEYMKKTSV